MATLNDLRFQLREWSENNYDSFLDDLERIIYQGELRVWRATNGLIGHMEQLTGTLTPSIEIQSILPSTQPLILASIQVGSVLLDAKTPNFVIEVSNKTSEGTPLYYSQTYLDETIPMVLVAPKPSTSLSYTLKYWTLNSLINNPSGTWLSERAYDIIFQSCLLEMMRYLEVPADRKQSEFQKLKQKLVSFNSQQIDRNLSSTYRKVY